MQQQAGEAAWLGARDVRVVALRALLLAVVAPLLVVAYQAAYERLPERWPLRGVQPWFWRYVLFTALLVVVPASLVERVGQRLGRPWSAAALAALVSVPGALAAMAQAFYAGAALQGDLDHAGATAVDALRALLTQPPRRVAGQALALAVPMALVTWARARGVPLRAALPTCLVGTALVAIFALHVVSGYRPRDWVFGRTDLWTALAAAALLPPGYALVDRVERRLVPEEGLPSDPARVV